MQRKSPADQAGQKIYPAEILTVVSSKNSIKKKNFSTTQKPFMRWWEDTLDHHWPYEVPANLTPDKQRIWKLAEIGHALRTIEAKNGN
tara:strand:- start:125 stop:388 length:264 start_codon:yes stop_codon:yes gene_type:complete